MFEFCFALAAVCVAPGFVDVAPPAAGGGVTVALVVAPLLAAPPPATVTTWTRGLLGLALSTQIPSNPLVQKDGG